MTFVSVAEARIMKANLKNNYSEILTIYTALRLCGKVNQNPDVSALGFISTCVKFPRDFGPALMDLIYIWMDQILHI